MIVFNTFDFYCNCMFFFNREWFEEISSYIVDDYSFDSFSIPSVLVNINIFSND